jgi:hypothetical protein
VTKGRITGQFAPRTIEMLRSPAFRALSLTGHRILARIEIEHAKHGGKNNGKLPVTHADFQEFGIHHHAVGPGLREVSALGFVEQTQRGFAGVGEHHRPSLFRLTYLGASGAAPTDDWRQITTMAEAEEIAATARANKPDRLWTFIKFPMPENAELNAGKRHRLPMPVNGDETQKPRCRKPADLSRILAIYSLAPTVGVGPENQPKRPWSTPSLIEITDAATVAALRRAAEIA